jgi:hypothetical protein
MRWMVMVAIVVVGCGSDEKKEEAEAVAAEPYTAAEDLKELGEDDAIDVEKLCDLQRLARDLKAADVKLVEDKVKALFAKKKAAFAAGSGLHPLLNRSLAKMYEDAAADPCGKRGEIGVKIAGSRDQSGYGWQVQVAGFNTQVNEDFRSKVPDPELRSGVAAALRDKVGWMKVTEYDEPTSVTGSATARPDAFEAMEVGGYKVPRLKLNAANLVIAGLDESGAAAKVEVPMPEIGVASGSVQYTRWQREGAVIGDDDLLDQVGKFMIGDLERQYTAAVTAVIVPGVPEAPTPPASR